jgi:inosine triphosphate pyrophosphatase
MNTKLTFITGNENKVRELNQILGTELKSVKLDLPEIQSLDMSEIIELKVREAYKVLNSPVLVDDVSLRFTQYGKLPGPFIKWFIKDPGIEKICRMLDAFEDRSATAECYYGYFDGNEVRIFIGLLDGTISKHPRGESGFGFDPIFIPENSDKSFAEMTAEEKNSNSHRSRAAAKLKEFLATN